MSARGKQQAQVANYRKMTQMAVNVPLRMGRHVLLVLSRQFFLIPLLHIRIQPVAHAVGTLKIKLDTAS